MCWQFPKGCRKHGEDAWKFCLPCCDPQTQWCVQIFFLLGFLQGTKSYFKAHRTANLCIQRLKPQKCGAAQLVGWHRCPVKVYQVWTYQTKLSWLRGIVQKIKERRMQGQPTAMLCRAWPSKCTHMPTFSPATSWILLMNQRNIRVIQLFINKSVIEWMNTFVSFSAYKTVHFCSWHNPWFAECAAPTLEILLKSSYRKV